MANTAETAEQRKISELEYRARTSSTAFPRLKYQTVLNNVLSDGGVAHGRIEGAPRSTNAGTANSSKGATATAKRAIAMIHLLIADHRIEPTRIW